ncbi:MAG: hypothetical protein H7232_19290 [Aeromicrobium sp.]|nr:hypothetical protein [Burkholderiales bacterium]
MILLSIKFHVSAENGTIRINSGMTGNAPKPPLSVRSKCLTSTVEGDTLKGQRVLDYNNYLESISSTIEIVLVADDPETAFASV